MILFVDESNIEGSSIPVLGCTAIDDDLFIKLENSFLEYRLQENVWSELKWSKCTNQYLDKYNKFIDLYFSNNSVTFHSWKYTKPTREDLIEYYGGDYNLVIHRHKYMLIRSVIRKCINAGKKNIFYIIIDSSDETGQEEAKIISDILNELHNSDIHPRPNIKYCNMGSSSILGGFYINDILLGAVANKYNKDVNKKYSREITKKLIDLNDNDIIYAPPRLPKLNEYKMHHFAYSR